MLELFTIYWNTPEYPGKFVVRKFVLDQPTDEVTVNDTLEAARTPMMQRGLYRQKRDASDHHSILETWF